MKAFTLLITFLLINAGLVFSQTIENPYFKSSDDPSTTITKVERTAKFTIITFEHTQTGEGWVNLSKSVYLQDSNGDEIFKFIKAEGIPLSPAKKNMKGDEGKFSFKVYFEKVPSAVKSINIIERATSRTERVSYFNFFEVNIEKAGKPSKEMNVQRV